MDDDHAKTDVVVEVVWVVVVAIGTAGVPLIVVPGAATQNPYAFGLAPQRAGTQPALHRCLGFFAPAVQQPTDLADHAGHVLVLAYVQQLQVVAQAQVETQLLQFGIGRS